jgi:hypothetical protein
MVVLLVDQPKARNGPLSTTLGLGPFTCGRNRRLAAHAAFPLAPDRHHNRLC